MSGHDELRLLAFLAGELDPIANEQFCDHLARCSRCRREVDEDRRGRVIAEGARRPLHDEALALLETGLRSAQPVAAAHRRPTAMMWAAAVLVVFGLGGAAALAVRGPDRERVDPVAAIETMLDDDVSTDAAAVVDTVYVGGVSVAIARSASPFPMPIGSTAAMSGRVDVWMMQIDGVNMVCVNGDDPVLVASTLPPERLLELLDTGQLV